MPDVDKAEARARARRSNAPRRSATAGPRRSPRSRSAASRGCAARTDEALAHFDRATESPTRGGDLFTSSVAGNLRARLHFLRGEIDAAEQEFVQTLLLSIRLHYDEGVAYGLEGLCAVAAARGDAWRAGALAVAAAERSGTASASSTSRRSPCTRRISPRCARAIPTASRRASARAPS